RSEGRSAWLAARRNHDGLDEFVRRALFVTLAQGLDGIGGTPFGFAVHDRAIGALDALPAVIAVHRVVAAHERCDAPRAQLPHFLLQFPKIIDAAMRRR